MSCDPKMTGSGKSSGNSSGSGGSGGSESNGNGGNNGSGEGGSNEKLANDTTEANIKFNKQRVDEITAELRKKGYNDIQIAAVLGHWKNESGFRLDALNRGDGSDGSDSIGLAQWNSSRAIGLRNYAAQNGLPVNSVAAQVGWFDQEMKTTHKSVGNSFKNATTIAEASWAMNKYEGFKGYKDVNGSQTISRLQNSNTFYSYITKK